MHGNDNQYLRFSLCLCLILLIVFGAFSSCLKNGFVNWDDDNYIVNNTAISSVSTANLKNIFSSFFVGHYQPLTILSYALDYHFYKLNPYHYHLTNLILHLLNSLLVFYLIYLLSGNIIVSFITAILFGLHPLHVESVAWVSERKDVLYSFFFLLSCITYLYYLTKGNKHKYYILSLFLFLCSLLSKSIAVTLPLVILLLDYYLKRKPSKTLFLDKIPYFVLSIIFAIIAIFGVYLDNVVRSEPHFNLFSILSVASYAIIFYFGKLFLPIKLSCLYPYHNFEYNPTYLYSIIAVVLLGILIALSVKYTKKILFGTLFFLITLLPALQFIPNGEIIVADRYTYISSIGIFFIIATLIYWFYSKKLEAFVLLLVILIISTLSIMTYNRCKVWKDGITLWSDALRIYPDSATAYNNRGAVFLGRKQYDKAYSDLNHALNIDPVCFEAYFNLGSLYNFQSNYNEAVRLLNKTLEINPRYLKAYNMLALSYGRMGEHYKVIEVCKKALEIDPRDIDAYINLCSAYGNLGKFQEAIAYGQQAVNIDPMSGAAHSNLAAAYFYAKEYDLAIKHCDKAIESGTRVDSRLLDDLKPYRK